MNIFSQITNMISSNLNIMFLESVFDYIIASIFRISCYILNLVKLILNLIFDLAGTDFFSAEAIGDIGKRLYVLLGIFMLIKITISCVTYLINPDKSDDKENGFGSIIKRTVISLLLLLAVPSVFNFAKQAQIAIVDTLPKIILGNAGNVDIDDVGERIAYSTMLAFVDYTEGCNDGSIAGRPDANGQIVDYQNGAGNIKVYSMDSLINNASEVISATCGSKKRYEVLWYLAPLVAGYLVFMLVSMAFYVGIRTIKFGFLQLIAPIPIASYVDPKSSKKSFDSWVHNCVSVYIDLFIRLGVIYLMIYLFEIVLGSITSSVVVYGETIGGPRVAFIKLFIILSIILFAKEAPKFISDVLGIKAEGSISEMFKRGAGLAGASVAGLRTARSNYTSQKERAQGMGFNKSKAMALGLRSAVAGAGSATGRGIKMATFDKKGYKDIKKTAFKSAVTARKDRNNRIDNSYSKPIYDSDGKVIKKGYGVRDYISDKIRGNLDIPSNEQFKEVKYKGFADISKATVEAKAHGAKKMSEDGSTYIIDIDPHASIANRTVSKILGTKFTNDQIATIIRFGETGQSVNVRDENGNIIRRNLTENEVSSLKRVEQDIQKATSYRVEVGLMANGDPGASNNFTIIKDTLNMNSSLFTDPEVFNFITDKLKSKKVAGADNVKTFDDLMNIVDELNRKNPKPKSSEERFNVNGKFDEAKFDEAMDAFLDDMKSRATILEVFKGAFEDIEAKYKGESLDAARRVKAAQNAQNDGKK